MGMWRDKLLEKGMGQCRRKAYRLDRKSVNSWIFPVKWLLRKERPEEDHSKKESRECQVFGNGMHSWGRIFIFIRGIGCQSGMHSVTMGHRFLVRELVLICP
jgi:hypothetical protein